MEEEEEAEEEATAEDKAGRRKRRSNKDDAMLCLLNVCVVGMGVSVLLSAVCVLYLYISSLTMIMEMSDA